jgi:hypothetical protein
MGSMYINALNPNLPSRLMTPIEECIAVSHGLPDPNLVIQLTKKNYDFAPISGVQGVISVQHLQDLLKSGSPLLADDRQIRRHLLDESSDLEQLLEIVAEANPVLVTQRGEVIGLLTLSDLNKPAIRSALYSKFANFEKDLADLILRVYKQDEDSDAWNWQWIEKLSGDSQVKILGHWQLSKKKNVVVGPIVACTLTELLRILESTDKIRDIFGFKSRSKANEECGSLPDWRNSVMHPVRPLVTESKEVEQLLLAIRRMERLGEAIRKEISIETPF